MAFESWDGKALLFFTDYQHRGTGDIAGGDAAT